MIRSYWNEEWRELKFEEGALRKRYAISNYGRIVSYTDNKIEEGTIVRGGSLRGYKTMPVRPFGKSKTFYVHKLVAEYFLEKERLLLWRFIALPVNSLYTLRIWLIF